MDGKNEKAILIVSFGTSYADAERKNICRIEDEIAGTFPGYALYRAWTSGKIRKKLLKRDGRAIDDVKGALKRMKADGVRKVTVQPTHVMNGIENDRMREETLIFQKDFEDLRIGAPLITSHRDAAEAVEALAEKWKDLPEKDALVLMGHGTEHDANFVYAALDYMLKDAGCGNIFVGTVEAYPSLETLLSQIGRLPQKPETIHLAPFMIVAGDHARNDMAGEEAASWKSRFEEAGYTVQCHLTGLGEYAGIRRILIRHAKEAK